MNQELQQQSRQAAKQHKEQLEAMEFAASQQAEQAQRLSEQLEEHSEMQREAIEEAARAAEMAAENAAEQHRLTTANAWKLQSQAKSERASSLYEAGLFDEAYKLATQSIEQDPANLQGFAIAASSLIALNQHDKARPLLQEYNQLLNFFEWRDSPHFFLQLLKLLSSQEDLFLLSSAFSSCLRKNIGFWRTSHDSAGTAVQLAHNLVKHKMAEDAVYLFSWLLKNYSSSSEILSATLSLLRLLLQKRGEDSMDWSSAVLNDDPVPSRADALISECYLFEIHTLIGGHGRARLDRFFQKVAVDSHAQIESDIPRIKRLGEAGELSPGTVAHVLQLISRKFAEWKSTMETQLYETGMRQKASTPGRTLASWWGLLSAVLLMAAASLYTASKGIRLNSVGPLLAIGAIIAGFLIGGLYGRYFRRLRAYRETKSRLAGVFAARNKTLASLGLPALTYRAPSGMSTTLEPPVYAALVIAYVAIWFALISAVVTPAATLKAASGTGASGLRAPLKHGSRYFNPEPRHIQTWGFGGGSGVDVQLIQAKLQAKSVQLVFRVHAGPRGDLLIYEPPGSKHQKMNADNDFEELYIQDEKGARLYSTTGFVGGRQVSFNNYNRIRRINFAPGEEVILSVAFPPVSNTTSTITFVSPRLNGWQTEWRWSAIALR